MARCTYSFQKSKFSGFTLIEIVLTLALVGVIAAGVLSVNLFGQNVFKKGGNSSEIQQAIRFMGDELSQKVRYAYGVEILPDMTTVPAVGSVPAAEAYVFLDTSSSPDKLYYRDSSGDRVIGSSHDLNVAFEYGSNNRMLKFSFFGHAGGQDYQIISEVLPLNLPMDSTITDSTGTSDGKVVHIYKQLPYSAPTDIIITNAPPSPVNVGTTISHQFASVNGNGSYTYSVTGNVPQGLSLSSSGLLSGKVNTAGTYTFKVDVVDGGSPQMSGYAYFGMVVTTPSASGPTASDLVISGSMTVGSTLTAGYTYTGGIEGASIIKWYRSSYNNGTGLVVETDQSPSPDTYVLTSDDLNHYIYIKVTPVNDVGLAGAEVLSFPTAKITSTVPNDPPLASALKITGNLIVGQTLTGGYTYSDTEDDDEHGTKFEWARASLHNGSDMTIIAGETRITYTLTDADYKKYIFFIVTPGEKYGSGITQIGPRITSSSVGKIDRP